MKKEKTKAMTINQYIMDTIEERNPEEVEDLVNLIHMKYSISKDEITKKDLGDA